jgi:hypothetical protein
MIGASTGTTGAGSKAAGIGTTAGENVDASVAAAGAAEGIAAMAGEGSLPESNVD